MRLIAYRLKDRWQRRGGYKEVLVLAAPLILSTGAMAVQEFVDRMFLSWYSPESIAAATPAGILHFAILSFFIGIASYVNTFVAQYYGAGRRDRIGPSVWHGVYIALIGGLLNIMLVPLSPALFLFIGHPPEVQVLESIYFRILCFGAVFPIASAALSGFFSGRGKPWPIMIVNTLATALNVVLNYALIFGNWGFPELGIAGAGISTVISTCFACIILLILILRPAYNRVYATVRGWAPSRELFSRLLRFGLPNGVQFFIDVFGFTVFILLVGRLGTVQLAATNIAFNINALAFMPMLGLGVAVSVLVGQYLGENRVELAERSVYSGAAVSFLYMGGIACAYVTVPGLFVSIFSPHTGQVSFESIREIAVILLRFVAIYSLFDTMNIVFASAVKGAGDTRFVMFLIIAMSSGFLVIPSYLALVIFKVGIYGAWIILSLYIILLGFCFLFRFLGGKWKSMRVI